MPTLPLCCVLCCDKRLAPSPCGSFLHLWGPVAGDRGTLASVSETGVLP